MAKRFKKDDQDKIAEYVIDTHRTRKNSRRDLERLWTEIDRQLRLEPDLRHKQLPDGRPDTKKAWLPEVELPLQAQTHEITVADSRRMFAPDSGPWFAAHVAMTDEFLDRIDFTSIIAGDENDIPSKVNQDNADKLIYGLVDHWHKQYDFHGNVDLIVSDAVKYGTGVGRARHVNKRVFMHTTKGVIRKEMKIPMLVPRCIKNVYLDDSSYSLNNEGFAVSPGTISFKTQSIEDFKKATQSGDGWIKSALAGLEGDDKGNIEVLEWEGDIIVPRSTSDNLYLPGAIITVVIGWVGKNAERRTVRIRENPYPFSSFIEVPYHREHIDTPYGTSPLMKGHHIQVAAVSALCRLMEASALNTQPPIGFDGDDQSFIARGGPMVYPGAQWATTGEIKEYKIGDPSSLFAVYAGLLQQYADVTGVNAPRLGAQTVSHTTAYAKEAELSRGTIRTVDFVRSTLKGPLSRWLDIAYHIGSQDMVETTFFVPQYQGYVTLKKNQLPKDVEFEAYGSGGPAEEQQKQQARMAALNQAVQLDQLNVQLQMSMGQPPQPRINLAEAIDQLLREGGWPDVDAITNIANTAGGVSQSPGMGGTAESNPGTVSTALQALAFGGG